tara:strand:- start:734 stop:1171 length:438 start_codon:yes stop_codon:yes gene_type:complete
MSSSLDSETCQPIAVFLGKKARLRAGALKSNEIKLNFNNLNGFFDYQIKISKFASDIFSFQERDSYFAYLIEVFVESDNYFDTPFIDTNIFFEKDFEDFVEYSIILPRLFKRHHRYVIDFERDNVCTFKQFGEKVNLWKKFNGLL